MSKLVTDNQEVFEMIRENANVCLNLLRELGKRTVSPQLDREMTKVINTLARFACDLYSEMHPELEDEEDEDIC